MNMLKRVYVLAFLITVVIIAGVDDGQWALRHYTSYYDFQMSEIYFWLPMWAGIGVGCICTIGRDER